MLNYYNTGAVLSFLLGNKKGGEEDNKEKGKKEMKNLASSFLVCLPISGLGNLSARV